MQACVQGDLAQNQVVSLQAVSLDTAGFSRWAPAIGAWLEKAA